MVIIYESLRYYTTTLLVKKQYPNDGFYRNKKLYVKEAVFMVKKILIGVGAIIAIVFIILLVTVVFN
jgi:hypothetical protein